MAKEKKVKIVDRGVKLSIKDCESRNLKLIFLNFIQAIGVIGLVVFISLFQQSTKYFVVEKNKNVEKLRHIDKDFKIGVANLYDYTEKTIITTFSLSYDTFKEQLINAESYYNRGVFEKLFKEMKRTSYFTLLKQYHRSYYVIPTPTVYNAVKAQGNNRYMLFRSFFVKSIGDDGVNKQEVVYAVTIQLVAKSKEHYSGMMVINVHQYSLNEYYQKFDTKGLSGNGGV
jgi:hypothetical protein